MTEIECELIGWADCTMNCTKYPTSAPEPVTKYFNKTTCTEQNITVTHLKQVQECKNVTTISLKRGEHRPPLGACQLVVRCIRVHHHQAADQHQAQQRPHHCNLVAD